MQLKRKKIAQVYGFWGQNIGNAFFNVGGGWLLRQMFPNDQVSEIQDQPAYRTFNKKANGNPKNDVNLLEYLDSDYIVLQGPLMTESMEAVWGKAFEKFKERGVKVILLGAAGFKFTKEEEEATKRFFDKYPPAIISTRDSDSYERIKDLCEFTYDGLDSAFFIKDAYTPLSWKLPPYYTFCFDRWPEPNVKFGQSEAQYSFEFGDLKWGLDIPSVQQYFSKKGKAWAYLGHLLDRRKLPAEINCHMLIRPEHRVNPDIVFKIYQHANAVSSDEPYTYFNIYANSSLTLSDRVHSCVATIAYGNPAMLFTPSPRAKLFERIGATQIKEKPFQVDMSYLESEKSKQITFLKNAVGVLGRRS